MIGSRLPIFVRAFALLLLLMAVRALAPPALAAVVDPATADAPASPPPKAESTFNSGFLFGAASQADLSRFASGNPVLAGQYDSDVYTNGNWKGRFTLTFRNLEDETQATMCFTSLMLQQFGIDGRRLPAALRDDPQACAPLSSWISDANARADFDPSSLRLDIVVPQTYTLRQMRNYVSPALWSEGIPAVNIGYNLNTYNSRYSAGEGADASSAYLGLDMGLGYAGWLLKQQGSVNWQNGSASAARWDVNRTYLQRGIAAIESQITLGDVNTSGEFFDSTSLRGVDLRSDDQMLPDELRSYAPEVRGVAESNALVTVRQNGDVIYQTSVTPGPFVIDDLDPAGFGSELQVTITEADGRERTFTVPYTSFAQLLRAGLSRYALSAGRVAYTGLNVSPLLYQGTYQRGLTNLFTGYLGATGFDGYSAMLLGSGWNTPWGAMSFDVTHAQTSLDRQPSRVGQSYRLSFSRMFAHTGSSLLLSTFRYSSSAYFAVNEAIDARDYLRLGRDLQTLRRERNGVNATLSQNLPSGWGGLYLNARFSNYWGDSGSQQQYQANYSNQLGALSYSLSVSRISEDAAAGTTAYYLNFSYPLRFGGSSTNLNGGASFEGARYQASRVGFSGTTGVDRNLSYSASVGQQRVGDSTGSFGATYQAPYSTLSGSFSQSRDYRQASLGAMGSLVLHQGGVTLAPQGGDTMVLVSAPNARGARLPDALGTRIDGDGYALVPYVRPYRMNTITIDPLGTSANVELQSTSQQVAPYSGTITKVEFATVTGRSILIHALQAGAEALPFGAEVTDAEAQNVGVVGQGSTIFIRTDQLQGRLRVQLGADQNAQCAIDYRVPEDQRQGDDYVMLEGVCT